MTKSEGQTVRVGITGHQHLQDPTIWIWVESIMRDELAKLGRPLTAVSSLAIGADQLLANLVLEDGGSIYAVLPYEGIERSFSPETLPAYKRLVERAQVEILSTPGTDEDAYLEAGFRVVDLSEVMFAVWNGLPAVGKGGTADVVAYAEEKRVPLIHINPLTCVVKRP